MKATVTLGKPIPPPKPIREKKIKLEMDELEAQRLYAVMNWITVNQLREIEFGNVKVGRIDIDILNALDSTPDGENGFSYSPEKLK